MDIDLFVKRFDELYSDYPRLNIHLAEDVARCYFNKYGRKPPTDWLEIIKEKSRYWTVKTHVGYANREVVSLARTSDILPDFEFSLEHLPYIMRITIVSVESPMVVYIRVMEYAKEFKEMEESKEMIWDAAFPTTLKQGSLYCVSMEGEESRFYRLRLLDPPGPSRKTLVQCELIDYGMTVKLEQHRLHQLHAKFMYLPAQAIKCNLLSERDVVEASHNHVDLATRICQNVLVGVDFRAKFRRTSDDALQLSLIEDNSDEPFNHVVLEHVKAILSPPPTLEPGKVYEIFVASIKSNGDCYARIKYPTLMKLKEFLSQIDVASLVDTVPDIQTERLYLAKVNDEWHRARILDLPNEMNCKARLRLIDTGMFVSTHLDNLVEVHPQSDLNLIPEQVVFMNVVDSMHDPLSQMSLNVPTWKVRVLDSDRTRNNCPRVSYIYESNPLKTREEAEAAVDEVEAKEEGTQD